MPTDDLPSRVPFPGALRTEPGRRAYLPRWAGPSRLRHSVSSSFPLMCLTSEDVLSYTLLGGAETHNPPREEKRKGLGEVSSGPENGSGPASPLCVQRPHGGERGFGVRLELQS